MKKLLMLLVIVGILISIGGCMSAEYMRNTLNKPVNELTVLEWYILK